MRIRRGLDGPFKFCTVCGEGFWGMRVILKAFGKNRFRADGLAVECKACRKRKTAAIKLEKMAQDAMEI